MTAADSGWVQAHASTLLAVPGGLLCAWFAGTREGTEDNQIWLARRGNASWSEPQVVASADEAHWNPVLSRGPDGAVWLFYKRGARISEWRTWVLRSEDEGRTWSAPKLLIPDDVGGRGPVKNPPLLLASGTWLAPASTEAWGSEPVWEAFVDRSADNGSSWVAVPIPLDRSRLKGAGLIQPALWLDESTGSIYALMRSTEGSAFLSSSSDEGATWSQAQPVELANNNSGLTAVSLPSGRVACVHNPVSGSWGPRCPLAVSVSGDSGTTWEPPLIIEDGVSPIDDSPMSEPSLPPSEENFAPADDGVETSGVGEYSYPAAVLAEGELVVTYTWQRRRIVECRVPLDLL